MAKEFVRISDGTFCLEETKDKNIFYFYRIDGKILQDINREPMELIQIYVMNKMMSGEMSMVPIVMSNIQIETTKNGKGMKITTPYIYETSDNNTDLIASKEKSIFLKKLFHKIFG